VLGFKHKIPTHTTQCHDLVRARALAQEIMISHTHTHTLVLNGRIYDEEEDEMITKE
jgi:hypothetical protein